MSNLINSETTNELTLEDFNEKSLLEIATYFNENGQKSIEAFYKDLPKKVSVEKIMLIKNEDTIDDETALKATILAYMSLPDSINDTEVKNNDKAPNNDKRAKYKERNRIKRLAKFKKTKGFNLAISFEIITKKLKNEVEQ